MNLLDHEQSKQFGLNENTVKLHWEEHFVRMCGDTKDLQHLTNGLSTAFVFCTWICSDRVTNVLHEKWRMLPLNLRLWLILSCHLSVWCSGGDLYEGDKQTNLMMIKNFISFVAVKMVKGSFNRAIVSGFHVIKNQLFLMCIQFSSSSVSLRAADLNYRLIYQQTVFIWRQTSQEFSQGRADGCFQLKWFWFRRLIDPPSSIFPK